MFNFGALIILIIKRQIQSQDNQGFEGFVEGMVILEIR